jgi:predicted nucleotidyltransferase
MTDFRGLLDSLVSEGVDFILIGGVAATIHGSSRLTSDIDVVYSRDAKNLERIVRALESHEPYLRGAPPGLPFQWDVDTLRRGSNFTLTTDLGAIDLLGHVTGGGEYKDLLPHTLEVEVFGLTCRCLDLDALIAVKRAAGRPKDLEAIAELEALHEEREKSHDD